MLLAIYLNDHLAGATGGLELARRTAGANRESQYASFLEGLATEIEEDRESLLAAMRALEVGVDRMKVVAGWSAEKFGRLKLNGRLLGYSPLSRVVELEALALGVSGKLALWRALQRIDRPELAEAGIDLPALIERAQLQLDGLEAQRLDAVAQALG